MIPNMVMKPLSFQRWFIQNRCGMVRPLSNLEVLQNGSDLKSQKCLEALQRTLDRFHVSTAQRPNVSEALLRFLAFAKHNRIKPKDSETQAFMGVLEEFKRELAKS